MAGTDGVGPRVGAVVVTYHPDATWPTRLEGIRAQVSAVVVVDNGSQEDAPLPGDRPDEPSLGRIRNRVNLGVAAAMNQGIAWLASRGFEWALTLDQDSLPAPGMVHSLWEAVARRPDSERVALAAPVGEEPQAAHEMRFLRPGGVLGFRRSPCRGEALDDVTWVNSSGCLHRMSVHAALGGFREDLFLDYVDTDYCLRARSQGFRIVVVCQARLRHTVGRREARNLLRATHYPTFHPPERWYYMSRNRIPMIRTYARRFPHWFTYEIVSSTYRLIRMLLFEDRRKEKLKAIVKGTIDGLLGRLGPGALRAS